MSSGIEPIPVPMPDGNWTVELVDAILREAFRQGWLSARHWPNHQLPDPLTVELEETTPGEMIRLEISW